MFEIHAHDSFEAPIERVFSAVSDHARFIRGAGVSRCVVTRKGDDHDNGLGAIREVFSGPIHFVEEVVRFEPPHRYDYVITKVTFVGRALPVEHEGGSLVLSEHEGRVHVDWRSRFRLAIPLGGDLGAKLLGRRFAASFHALLAQAKRDLAREAASGQT